MKLEKREEGERSKLSIVTKVLVLVLNLLNLAQYLVLSSGLTFLVLRNFAPELLPPIFAEAVPVLGLGFTGQNRARSKALKNGYMIL